ncbi:MAG: inositol-3-phosphate synthase [Verrucomicrobia bacterium]|nr:inositol-3-phosphate synthase [Verrucomicrobiota bacterium]
MGSPENTGTLGIFTVGMGAVATTLMAGVELIRRGRRPAVGSYSQLGWLSGPEGPPRRVAEAVGLTPLRDLVFGGVDLIESNAREAARTAGVLSAADLAEAGDFLASITAGPGVHDSTYVRNLPARRVRPEAGKLAQAEAMTREIRDFFASRGCARGVVLLTLSTEAWREPAPCHATVAAFRAGLERNDPEISPSQIYAWAAIAAGYPVVNCTPNLVLEVPAIRAAAEARGVPIAGSDLKSGQTMMKTVVAAGLAKRLFGVRGWFSTNILGNRDGLVLDEPENFRAKEVTKGGVLSDIFDAGAHPELYGDLHHQVHINYYPPKGDNKEAWDAIQLFGWLGYEMELKINFQCRDSIMAAPLVLDLALFTDLAARRGERGVQSWLGGYFKNPAALAGEKVSNDLHVQIGCLEEKLRGWR